MTILATHLTLEEVNACFLRIQRQMKNNESALESKILTAINANKGSILNTTTLYDDKWIKTLTDKLKNDLESLKFKVEQVGENIEIIDYRSSNNQERLNTLNLDYDEDTNTLTYTNPDDETTAWILKDTTYTFTYNQTNGDLTITNDLDDTDTLTIHDVGITYSINFNNGNLSLINNLTGATEVISLDARYYRKEQVDDLIDEVETKILNITNLIPADASSSNLLATRNFVNSSIETATATFRGTFPSVAALNAYSGPKDLNDYAFVKSIDSSTGLYQYDRYKYTGSEWVYEYTLNTSGFTADQLAAINSGITANLVSKITDVNNCKITVCQGNTCVGSFTLNQGSNCVLSFPETTANNCRVTICQGTTCAGSFTLNQNTNSTVLLPAIPTVNNPTITICQGTTCAGSFTLNQNGNCTISLSADDDHCVIQSSSNTDAIRCILFTPAAPTCDSCYPVYYSSGRPLTYNTCTGVLNAETLTHRYGYVSNCYWITATNTNTSGWPVVRLLYDITNWYNGTTGLSSTSLSGTLRTSRSNGYGTSSVEDINVYFNYGRNGAANPGYTTMCMEYSLLNGRACATPIVVSNGTNYYLALCFTGYNGMIYSFTGLRVCSGVSTDFSNTWLCTTSAAGALPSGWTKIYTATLKSLNDSAITICQGTDCIGSFTLNQSSNCTINLPTVPTVNDGRITICQGSSCIGSFTLNQSGNGTITLPVAAAVYDCTITVCQNSSCIGSFTLNQTSNKALTLTDCKVLQNQINDACRRPLLTTYSFQPTTGSVREVLYPQCLYPAFRACDGLMYSCNYTYAEGGNPRRFLSVTPNTYTGLPAGSSNAVCWQCFISCLYYNMTSSQPTDFSMAWTDACAVWITGLTSSATCVSGWIFETVNLIGGNASTLFNSSCPGWIQLKIKAHPLNGAARNIRVCKGSSTATAPTFILDDEYDIGAIRSGSFNGVAATVTNCCLCFNNIGFQNICNASPFGSSPSTTTRRIIAAEWISGEGYTTRLGLGLCRGSTGWSKGVLSVGCDTNGACFWDYYFSNNGQITNACLVHTCTLPSPNNTVTYAKIKVGGACRAIQGKLFKISDYSMDATLNLDSATNYYTGTLYGLTGFQILPYSCSNCDCFWIRYTSYRQPIICSDSPFEVLCTTTTAPTNITFTTFTPFNPISCCNSTCSSGLPVLLGNVCDSNNGTLTVVNKNINVGVNPSCGRLYSCQLRATNYAAIASVVNSDGTINSFCPTILLNCGLAGRMIQISGIAGCDKGYLLQTAADYNGNTYCNIGMQVGSGNVNRGFYHRKAGSFSWLQYWDGCDVETHTCTTCFNENVNLAKCLVATGCVYSNGNYSCYSTTCPIVCCYAMTAGCTYYINLGTARFVNEKSGDLDLTLSSYGNGNTDSINVKWNLGYGGTCSWNYSGVHVSASHYSGCLACGIRGIGICADGNVWNCSVGLVAQFIAPSTATYRFSLTRNRLPTIGNGWTTAMTCSATAPTYSCFVCTKGSTATACQWFSGNTCIANLSNTLPQYSLRQTITQTIACPQASLVITTNSCQPRKRLLIVACSSCAGSYRTCIYIDSSKAGCQNEHNINACFVSGDCDALVPYRVSANNNVILVDFATCTGASITANVFTMTDFTNSQGISCAWDESVLLSWNCTYPSCTFQTSVSANINCITNGNLFTNLNANIVSAYCIATTSSEKYKKNIIPWNDSALNILRNTDIVTYNYKAEKDDDLVHYGFLAEHTPKALSGSKQDQMRVNDSIGILIKAVKELDERTQPWYKRLIKRIKKWH